MFAVASWMSPRHYWTERTKSCSECTIRNHSTKRISTPPMGQMVKEKTQTSISAKCPSCICTCFSVCFLHCMGVSVDRTCGAQPNIVELSPSTSWTQFTHQCTVKSETNTPQNQHIKWVGQAFFLGLAGEDFWYTPSVCCLTKYREWAIFRRSAIISDFTVHFSYRSSAL